MSSQYSNFAASALTALLPASSPTAYITAGSGVKFPLPGGTATFKAVITRALDQAREVVECTVRSGDICTITRAQEGTTALDFVVGDTFELRVTAGQMTDLLGAVALHQTTAKSALVAADQVVILDSATSFSAKVSPISSFLSIASGYLNVKSAPFNAVGDGVTDDSVAINAAITAAAALGGGYVLFPPTSYLHNTAITLQSGVILTGYGATLKWGGGATAQITSPTTNYLGQAGILGVTIDGGTTASTLLEVFSGYHCKFRDLTFQSISATNKCLDLRVNGTGALNPNSERNTVFCTFENLMQQGTCGTFIRLLGDTTLGSCVTVNSFYNIDAQSCSVYGIEFSGWCDTNYFAGITRISLAESVTATGVIWNTLTPTLNAGVYADNFDHLAVDTFGVGAARIGIQFNNTKDNKLGYYFQDPVAGGGAIVVSAYCSSYDITHQIGGSNIMSRKILGGSLNLGGASTLASAIYTSNFSLTGAAQSSVNLADTFGSGVTSADGVFLNSRTGAASAITNYNGFHLTNPSLGAGATITTVTGMQVEDLTTGTNNYAILSAVSAGANKYGLNFTGTAKNYLAGNLGVGMQPTTTEALSVTGTQYISGTLGIGATPVTYADIYMTKNLDGTATGGYAYGIYNLATVVAATSQIGSSFTSSLAVASGATPVAVKHFYALQGTFTGTPANQYGFHADATLVGATANYGFYSSIPAAASRWNFYASGTANNAYAGNSSFGKVTVPTCAVDTTSHASNLATNAAATYTVLTTDSTIIQTTAASTYTLPAAASFPGRELHLVTQFAGAVISNASNVVPIVGGAAGTAILAATAGKFAHLQSNGTNWVITAAN